uniref:Ni/Fe-hydrogenase cytochrome b subunit n=1 Tax=candidate division WOR-3 bacterium TaxID=2052148 RepID=A0A7C2P4C9_UNCW3
MNERKNLIKFILSELKPKGPIFTPFNIITAPIILVGLIIIAIRFLKGLGVITHSSQELPWGLLIGFNVMTGIPWAGGAFCMAFVVYVMHFEKYKPVVRSAILWGLLSYTFYAGALVIDLGRWWNSLNPFIGNKFGFQSVLWLIAFHFLLYTICAFLEFAPIIAEWLSLEKIRKLLHSIRIPVVILGVTLSTLHQSGIGALTLMAKSKIHPLWWSEYTPVLFFLESIFGGMAMIILIESLMYRTLPHRIPEEIHGNYPSIFIGLAKGCAGTLFAYLTLKLSVFIHVRGWNYIISKIGGWYLVEFIGFGFLPLIILLLGIKRENLGLIRIAALMILIGILMFRLSYIFIAYKWYLPWGEKHFATWMEIWVVVAIILIQIWILRWIVNRMPVYVIEQEE